MDKIVDYKVNLDLLMQQWKDSANLVGIISASMDQANKMEDAIFEIRDLMDLENGEGVTLDYIGKVWNEYRDGRSDTQYREAISFKKTNYYSGEPEAIISIAKSLYNATYVFYSPEYPGKYRINTDATILNEELASISPAGVFGFVAGNLVTATKDNIVDAVDNIIIQVNTTDISIYNVYTSDGNQVVTSDNEILINEYVQ